VTACRRARPVPATRTVRLKSKVTVADEMTPGTRASKTVRVKK
jgi:hypothetical protein